MNINGINGYLSKFEGIEVDAAVERVQGRDIEFAEKVDKTTAVNGHQLTGDIEISAEDVGALPVDTIYAYSLVWEDNILYLKDQNGRVLNSHYIEIDKGRWGHIVGNIEDQEDLQQALAAARNLGLGDLNNVDLENLADGNVLKYDATAGKWVNSAAVTALSELTDVDLTNLVSGNILEYDAATGKWVNTTVTPSSTTLGTLTDVELTNLANGDVIRYDSATGKWENSSSGPGGASVWGQITGTLSDQTDLQSALDAKSSVTLRDWS